MSLSMAAFSPAQCHIITILQSVAGLLSSPTKVQINKKPLYNYQTLINFELRSWQKDEMNVTFYFNLIYITLYDNIFLKYEVIHKLKKIIVFSLFGFVYLSLSMKI